MRERSARTGAAPDPGLIAEVLRVAAQDLSDDGRALDALGAAAAAAGWEARHEGALIGGGTAELLIADSGRDDVAVAVVVAGRGATDALRRRLRQLAAHAEVQGIAVVTARSRHRDLERTMRNVPVQVVLALGDPPAD